MDLAEKDRLEVLEGLKTVYDMPEICRFLGIVIAMFYNDHDPPQFHAFYNDYTVRVKIDDGKVLSGQVPVRILKYLEEWRQLHVAELSDTWQKVQKYQPPGKISPLV